MKNTSKKSMKVILTILFMAILIAGIKLFAEGAEIVERLGIIQGDIVSKQYLVTDEYIARISPKTTVVGFVEQLGLDGREIKVYKSQEETES